MTGPQDPFAPPGGPSSGQPRYGQQPYGQQPWAMPAVVPELALRRAASRAHTASALLWVFELVWVVLLVGGLVSAAAGSADGAGDYAASYDRQELAEGLTGLGTVFYLGLGAAMWALLGSWTGSTAQAATAAGNGEGRSLAGLAWWGLFVPFASAVLPLLAYADAARYVRAAERLGGAGRGRGPGWRREPLPSLLLAWWALYVAAAISLFVALQEDDPGGPAGPLDLCAVLGGASSACGAVALRRLAGSTAAAAGPS